MKINRYLPIFLLVFITSCSENPSTPKESQKAESAGEIVNQYTNTLTTAQDKAKNAAGAVDARMGEDNKVSQEMDKQ